VDRAAWYSIADASVKIVKGKRHSWYGCRKSWAIDHNFEVEPFAQVIDLFNRQRRVFVEMLVDGAVILGEILLPAAQGGKNVATSRSASRTGMVLLLFSRVTDSSGFQSGECSCQKSLTTKFGWVPIAQKCADQALAYADRRRSG